MTPAAFLQTDTVRDVSVTARPEAALRLVRNPRRFTSAFISDAQTPLFHAWRP